MLACKDGADLRSRFFLDGLKSGLCLLTEFLKLAARLLQDFVHLLPLFLVQPQILVELIDVALGALGSVAGVEFFARPCDARLIKVGDEYSSGDANEKDRKDENLCL